ncbi:endothelin-2 isoform X2 [Motacilla alba alba]|uniref:endothelin-2 isoform X2 n=1 Tax=Motacilla alba alba TaxID=1094192 RepID=UPI0018D57771|nr:endothelin-2 isoform X2 [Motacilla alba alba]
MQRCGSAGRAGTGGKGGKAQEKPQSRQRRAAVMGSHPAVLLALALCALLEAGLGHPPAESHLAARPRSKRCSCNSWLDKECIYFCHLDIIWVNTPGYLRSLKLPVSSGASVRSLQSGATRPPHHGLLRALRDLRVSSPRSSRHQQRSRRDTQPPALPWEKNIWKKKR